MALQIGISDLASTVNEMGKSDVEWRRQIKMKCLDTLWLRGGIPNNEHLVCDVTTATFCNAKFIFMYSIIKISSILFQ